MSDFAQIIMRIDATGPSERESAAEAVKGWLLDAGVIVPSDQQSVGEEADSGRSHWSPGPFWRDIVEGTPDPAFESTAPNGVKITSEVDYESASGNNEPWECPRCELELDADDLIEGWIETHDEPTATCSSCGYSASLGDWPAEFPIVLVGAPIVKFHNWQPLRPDFIAELMARLGGGRSRYFWEHI